MTLKEQIIVTVLEFLMNSRSKYSYLIGHIAIIRMHMPGYEKLVEDYSKQIVEIMKEE